MSLMTTCSSALSGMAISSTARDKTDEELDPYFIFFVLVECRNKIMICLFFYWILRITIDPVDDRMLVDC